MWLYGLPFPRIFPRFTKSTKKITLKDLSLPLLKLFNNRGNILPGLYGSLRLLILPSCNLSPLGFMALDLLLSCLKLVL